MEQAFQKPAGIYIGDSFPPTRDDPSKINSSL